MSEKKNVKFDKEVPENVGKTAKRLFGQFKNQRGRLTIVGICIVFYVLLNTYTPYYSAELLTIFCQTFEIVRKPVQSFQLSGRLLVLKCFHFA